MFSTSSNQSPCSRTCAQPRFGENSHRRWQKSCSVSSSPLPSRRVCVCVCVQDSNRLVQSVPIALQVECNSPEGFSPSNQPARHNAAVVKDVHRATINIKRLSPMCCPIFRTVNASDCGEPTWRLRPRRYYPQRINRHALRLHGLSNVFFASSMTIFNRFLPLCSGNVDRRSTGSSLARGRVEICVLR